MITVPRDQNPVLLALFSTESSTLPYWSLNTAQVNLSRVSLCDHFSQPPTDYSLHVSWDNVDSSFSSACLACTEKLRILIHHRDKSYPFCYSQNTFHCQSLAYLTVKPDGWFTPLHLLQRFRSLVLPTHTAGGQVLQFEEVTKKKEKKNLKQTNVIQVILKAWVCAWKKLQKQHFYLFIASFWCVHSYAGL